MTAVDRKRTGRGCVKLLPLAADPTLRDVFEVLARWDSEAGVWVAESKDIPGLVAEADSPNNLARKLRILIPELLELNGFRAGRTARYHVQYEHEESDVLAS